MNHGQSYQLYKGVLNAAGNFTGMSSGQTLQLPDHPGMISRYQIGQYHDAYGIEER